MKSQIRKIIVQVDEVLQEGGQAGSSSPYSTARAVGWGRPFAQKTLDLASGVY